MPKPSRRKSKGGLSELELELREKEAALKRQMAEAQNLVRNAPAKRRRLDEEQRQRGVVIPTSRTRTDDKSWRLRATVATADPEDIRSRPLRSEVRRARAHFVWLLLILFGLVALIFALLV